MKTSEMSEKENIEEEAFKNFKERIADLLPQLPEFLQTDIHLKRWLRARNLNVDKAELMIRKSMKWREENDISNAFEWKFSDHFAMELPWRLSGYDKEGCPIIVIPFGKWRVKKLIQDGYNEEFLRGSFFCNETELALMKHKSEQDGNRTITQAVQIIDLEAFSWLQFASKPTLDAFLEQVQSMEDNYPEILKICYVINAPKVFTIFFSMVKPWLSEETLAKVNIFDSNSDVWKKALLQNIHPDNLPSEYGGSNTNCLNFHDLMEGVFDANKVEPKFVTFGDAVFVSKTVEAGGCLNVEYTAEVGALIEWAFETEDDDIAFSIVFMETKNVIVNPGKVDSHIHMQKGTTTCKISGKYSFCFDNSYSRTRAKVLRYTVSVQL